MSTSIMDGLADGEKSTTKVARDATYFFPHDFIILKVEDTLFRIPLFYLLKHLRQSGVLFNSLSRQPEGFTEENPFIVRDDISAEEFRHFLRIILPSVTENLETIWTNKNSVTKDEWISILKISTLWYCLSLRNMAIHALESSRPSFSLFSSQSTLGTDLAPIERISLGRKYSISSWVEAGYTALVSNGSVSDSEMEVIGAVESFKLMRIIQEASKPRFRSLSTTIKETFQAELSSIGAVAKSYLDPVDGVLVLPQSPQPLPAMGGPQTIDSSMLPHKLKPPPCNEYYLMTCSKGTEECKYSHGYTLTPEQLRELAIGAKKIPCQWLRNGVILPVSLVALAQPVKDYYLAHTVTNVAGDMFVRMDATVFPIAEASAGLKEGLCTLVVETEAWSIGPGLCFLFSLPV